MNILIVHYSPIADSFTKRIAQKLEALYSAQGDSVALRDLAAPAFNPVLTEEEIILPRNGKYLDDVLAEQSLVAQANRLALIFPIYSSAMPAMLKGYIDRVMTVNFAYGYTADGNATPLMTGKHAAFYCPMAAPFEYFQKSGSIDAMNHIWKNFCTFRGFDLDHIQYFDMNDRESQLNALRAQ